MIGINKCLSVKVCILLTWIQSSWKFFKAYIFEIGLCWKFDFRQDWKFCWDLSNVISGGNWLFRGGTVFPGETFYPSANYGVFILVYRYRRPNSGTQKREICISLCWNFLFQVFFLNLELRKTYFQVRKYTKQF